MHRPWRDHGSSAMNSRQDEGREIMGLCRKHNGRFFRIKRQTSGGKLAMDRVLERAITRQVRQQAQRHKSDSRLGLEDVILSLPMVAERTTAFESRQPRC